MKLRSGLPYIIRTLALFPLAAAVLTPPVLALEVPATLAQQLDQISPSAPRFVPDLGDRDRPHGRRRGGSSRGICAIANESLTAMVPVDNVSPEGIDQVNAFQMTYESILTLTTQERPTFWFHVPYASDGIDLEFVLLNADGSTLHQAKLNGHSASGVIKVELPTSVPPLQINQRYEWYLTAECDQTTDFVKGWTERVPMADSLSRQLATASPAEQTALYASHGLWQDSITLLAESYRQMPDNPTLNQAWYSLLESVDLAEVAQEPLIDCCQPQ